MEKMAFGRAGLNKTMFCFLLFSRSFLCLGPFPLSSSPSNKTKWSDWYLANVLAEGVKRERGCAERVVGLRKTEIELFVSLF